MNDEIIFGHIPSIAVGTTFISYAEMNAVGIHRSSMGGISGRGKTGADSVVISGGYDDDLDLGDVIVYTGQGGRDNSGKHIKDQELRKGNLALVTSEIEGLPVRVIRGADRLNDYAPLSGYRYDGLYRVESHWQDVGRAGFKVWRYRLVKLDSENSLQPRPETKTAQELMSGNQAPGRRNTIVQRVIRDTKQAKLIKQLHNYSCQICGYSIETPMGRYAEAAHIRPLGEPHNGPDTPDNILCLCPNHHVMFDLGTFSIEDDYSLCGVSGKLHLQNGHHISVNHLRYHRSHYFNQIEHANND